MDESFFSCVDTDRDKNEEYLRSNTGFVYIFSDLPVVTEHPANITDACLGVNVIILAKRTNFNVYHWQANDGSGYTDDISVTDNCDDELSISQIPAPETIISCTINKVIITVTDHMDMQILFHLMLEYIQAAVSQNSKIRA